MEDARTRAELERIAFGRAADPDARVEARDALAALGARERAESAENAAVTVASAALDRGPDAEPETTTAPPIDAAETDPVARGRLPRALLVGAALLAVLIGVGVGWAARGGGAPIAAPVASASASGDARIDVDARNVVLRCFTRPGSSAAASVVFSDYTAASDAYRDPPGACASLIPQSIDRMAIAERIHTVVDAGARCGSVAQQTDGGEDLTYFAASDGTIRMSHDPALIGGLHCDAEIVLDADPPIFQRSITCRSAQGIDVVGRTSDFADCPSP